MGLTTELSLHDNALGLSRKETLRIHIDSNFYPPHPQYVKDGIVNAFSDYWNGAIDDDAELASRCYLRDVSGLFRYFSTFM